MNKKQSITRLLLLGLLIAVSFLAGMFFKNQVAQEPNDTGEETGARLVINPVVEEAVALNKEKAPLSILDNGLTAQEQHNIRLFEESAPSVCFITTTTIRRNYYSRNVQEIPSGTGSGFIWDKEGHIVTNYHVIQNADRATVTLSDGTTYQASKVGEAREKDLVVLKIDAPRSKLTPIPLGSSANLRVGQSVYAIGNPFGLDQTLTTGIVSALGREINSVVGIPIRDAIQTDAAINPGNSGGPLLNSSGRLIGVNTAIYSPSGASAGIGFSIPVDVVTWVVPDLIKYGKLNRPMIGIELARPLRNITGAIVLNVVEGSPAEYAGMKAVSLDKKGNILLGDIIVAVNEEKITSNSDLYLALEGHKAGEEVIFTVSRDEKLIDLPIKLEFSSQ